MRSKQIGMTGVTIVAAALLAASPTPAQQVAETHQAALNACAEAVVGDFEEVYPKAKKLIWDMSRLTAEDSLFGDQLKGTGDYRGKGGKRRTLEYDCTYDPFSEQVVKAVWESSHDPGVVHMAVDLTGDMEIMPGKVSEACTAALDEKIRSNWPNYREMEILTDTLERRKTRDGYLLRGDGRFLGGRAAGTATTSVAGSTARPSNWAGSTTARKSKSSCRTALADLLPAAQDGVDSAFQFAHCP